MNKVILCGNLGADPESKTTQSGKTVCNFRMATNEGKEAVEWHTVVAWEKTGEIARQYLRKGSKVLVEGSIKTRSWEKDGTTHYRTEINAFRIELIDSKGNDGQQAQGQGYGGGGGNGGYGGGQQGGYGASGYQPAQQQAPAQQAYGADEIPW